ncbi:hypothetical protein CAC42_2482 [Sphaceloma murrayae]|uniref:Uncharacterized protein n=1 Tax=Sphaceloma murrayae TaxID=2082308 RepID=A0A2K1QW63_9PEZI|nr:hypothetical protein CAC42_2482 [Sphaceloma murrayae]
MSNVHPSRLAKDINLVSNYLAQSDIESLGTSEPVDCIAICASQVLHQATALFRILEARPNLTTTLVLVGGIGHSTQAIYDAVAAHPHYRTLATAVTGQPEARVLDLILTHFFDKRKLESSGCRVLLEDRSTNGGANATETKRVLDEAGLSPPKTCLVVQDQTMLRRSVATFEKVYENVESPPRFLAWPVFVPVMRFQDDELDYDVQGVEGPLWPKDRFYSLLVGEVRRLRDDENGYGPRGTGFIGHVHVPADVLLAADNIATSLNATR